MSEIGVNKVQAFQARKILGRSPALGEYMLGYSYIGDPFDVQGIYQIRHGTNGQWTCKMRSYRPVNPRTTEQQANRTKFAQAMSAWGSLTEEQQQAYDKRARRVNLFGKNLFIREFYQSH